MINVIHIYHVVFGYIIIIILNTVISETVHNSKKLLMIKILFLFFLVDLYILILVKKNYISDIHNMYYK